MLIQPGLRVFAEKLGRDVAVGPIVMRNGTDALYALLPAQSLLAGEEFRANGEIIGVVGNGTILPSDERGIPITSTVLPIQLNPGTRIEDRRRPVSTHAPRLADKVSKLQAGEVRVSGRITATDTPLFVKGADGRKRAYLGAIAIRGDDGPFAVSGDGGSMVVDAEGNLLGMIVAVAEGNAYIVPLPDLLERLDLQLADADSVEAHNARSQTSEQVPRRRDLGLLTDYKDLLHVLYGGIAFRQAFSTLDRVHIDLSFTGHISSHFDAYSEAMREAPRVEFKTISGSIADRPELLTAGLLHNEMTKARVNFLVGVQNNLPKTRAQRSEYAIRILKAHARTSLKHDALEIIGNVADHLSATAFRMATDGRPVSLETASLSILVLLDMAKAEGKGEQYSRSFLEPALYVIDDGAEDLLRHITEGASAQREFQEVFARVSAEIPFFPRYPAVKLLADVCIHKPLRYATAWILQRAVANYAGSGFKWRSSMNRPEELKVAEIEKKKGSGGEFPLLAAE